uniref:GATA-type domain-containing protein n=1 Tax=Meloidogyne incognita TaxID=6306 RepID=A0A914MWD4_MELIC
MCFNCRVTQTKHWYRYLKEHYLCQPCHEYKIYNGKMRPQGRLIQTKMNITFASCGKSELRQKESVRNNPGLNHESLLIENVILAEQQKHQNGTVIQYLNNIYVKAVTINNKK